MKSDIQVLIVFDWNTAQKTLQEQRDAQTRSRLWRLYQHWQILIQINSSIEESFGANARTNSSSKEVMNLCDKR